MRLYSRRGHWECSAYWDWAAWWIGPGVTLHHDNTTGGLIVALGLLVGPLQMELAYRTLTDEQEERIIDAINAGNAGGKGTDR